MSLINILLSKVLCLISMIIEKYVILKNWKKINLVNKIIPTYNLSHRMNFELYLIKLEFLKYLNRNF